MIWKNGQEEIAQIAGMPFSWMRGTFLAIFPLVLFKQSQKGYLGRGEGGNWTRGIAGIP